MSQAASYHFLGGEARVPFQDGPFEICSIISGTEANTCTISANLLQNMINIEACRLCRKPQYAD